MLGELLQSQAVLEEYRAREFECVRRNREHMSALKYELLTAIQLCLDMGNHLVSRLGARRPEDYADIFLSLTEAGVIVRGLAESLSDMARFRNRLVHIYWDIDPEVIQQILQSRLDDLRAFGKAISEHLDV